MVASNKPLKCVVVTPERAFLDETVDFVALPLYDGELGVLPGRAPLIGRLGFGELRSRRGNTVQRFYVDGGFAQVRDNVVTVLTPKAVKAADIDTQAVSRALDEARAAGPAEQLDQRLKAQKRARAQLQVAARASDTTVEVSS